MALFRSVCSTFNVESLELQLATGNLYGVKVFFSCSREYVRVFSKLFYNFFFENTLFRNGLAIGFCFEYSIFYDLMRFYVSKIFHIRSSLLNGIHVTGLEQVGNFLFFISGSNKSVWKNVTFILDGGVFRNFGAVLESINFYKNVNFIHFADLACKIIFTITRIQLSKYNL